LHSHLPFPALVGLDAAQQALLLLAVEPRLRGVVLSAAAGTGKSSLARGMRDLLGSEAAAFIEAPPSADVENLLGGLDLEATLRTGRTVVQPGILARAHGGVIYIDGINLLSDGSANLLLGVLDESEVRVERESLSLRAPARFSLIGSYDPAEGLPRNHLLDRVGLLVGLHSALSSQQRGDVIRHNLLTDLGGWDDDVEILRGLVLAGRDQLPAVTIAAEQIEWLTRTALLYGVEGHRVDLFSVYAACAAAALELRDSVEESDLELAARFTILPRATQIPTAPPEPPPSTSPPPPEPTQADEGSSDPADAPPPPDPGEEAEQPERAPAADELAMPAEQIFSALVGELPTDLEELPFRVVRRGRTGSRGATSGTRGRHVRSLPGDPRRARIDVSATLRAAAPWQPLRREAALQARNGSAPPAIDRVLFTTGDIRVKQYRSKAGALFCFAVDASGSMALHRMRQAKGAVQSLLQQAYVKRDRVALIAFRGEQAEILLPPSQSVELAQRALDLLPTGGGTPLASALLLATDVASQAKMRGIFQTVLVLLTDGRANVGLTAESDVARELEQIGRFVAESPLHVIVVDTQRKYLSRGEARRLAEYLGGDYAYLPNASGEEIAQLVTSNTT
jgi:magnesium chelatase subunit D